MWFWFFMFVCDLLVPMLMIVCGRMMWKHSPGKINGIVGYRTTRSMKNIDTWKFAHTYCGQLWWRTGWILLAVSAAAHIPFFRVSENVIGIVGGVLCAIQCTVLIVPVILTERALRRNFTDDGARRARQNGCK